MTIHPDLTKQIYQFVRCFASNLAFKSQKNHANRSINLSENPLEER